MSSRRVRHALDTLTLTLTPGRYGRYLQLLDDLLRHGGPPADGGRQRATAVQGLRDRRHHHRADRQLDRGQMVSAACGFGGKGEQLPHRERCSSIPAHVVIPYPAACPAATASSRTTNASRIARCRAVR
ncbi:hypothetical protein [Streptomyces roseochromogenus]|uniref:hypothetical protein n=1 Tax=Streptomyces roseochromogenus TaxID=285450 RepID=UPI000A472504|nr:hypothetical protein [Streptomyces roseochromogenus]